MMAHGGAGLGNHQARKYGIDSGIQFFFLLTSSLSIQLLVCFGIQTAFPPRSNVLSHP